MTVWEQEKGGKIIFGYLGKDLAFLNVSLMRVYSRVGDGVYEGLRAWCCTWVDVGTDVWTDVVYVWTDAVYVWTDVRTGVHALSTYRNNQVQIPGYFCTCPALRTGVRVHGRPYARPSTRPSTHLSTRTFIRTFIRSCPVVFARARFNLDDFTKL